MNAFYLRNKSFIFLNFLEHEQLVEWKRTNVVIFEPPRGKTNKVVSDQVRHKSGCTVTEAG